MTSAVPFLRRLPPTLLLAALLLAPNGRALAYCLARECSLDAPDGERCVRDVETGCSSQGVQLARSSGCIQFAVQRGTGDALGLNDEQLEDAIADAFDTWAAVDCGDGAPSLRARSVGSVDIERPFACLGAPDLNIDTWFMSDELAGRDAITAHSGATAGQTRPSFFVEDGAVFDADVLLNELWFVVQREEDVDAFLHVVALHEAGHALGLAHSLDQSALMHRDYRVTRDRTLTQDDIDGVCALFPPQRLDCGAPTKPPAAFLEDACSEEEERRDDETPAAAPTGDATCSVREAHGASAGMLAWLGALLAIVVLAVRRRSRQLALAAALALLGCSSAKPATKTQDVAAADDEELLARIAELTAACELPSPERLSCQSAADEELAKEFITGKRDRMRALPTLARLLRSEDQERVAIAAQLLSLGFSIKLGDELAPGAVPAGVSSLLLDALGELPIEHARRITPATVHAAMLAGQGDALFAAVTARRDPELERMAYRRAMVHGRLTPLPRIQALADGPDAQLASAALEALRNMPSWTAAEQDVLCPFATRYFEGEDAARSARAAQALAHCEGEHVAAVIASSSKLKARGGLDGARLLPLLDVCKRPADVANGACHETLSFLESALADHASPAQLRVAALTAIVHQTAGAGDRIDGTSPDPKLLRRVLETYASDASPELARHAQRMHEHFAAMSAATTARN